MEIGLQWGRNITLTQRALGRSFEVRNGMILLIELEVSITRMGVVRSHKNSTAIEYGPALSACMAHITESKSGLGKLEERESVCWRQ